VAALAIGNVPEFSSRAAYAPVMLPFSDDLATKM
jgi:hypothetical protein